MTGGPMTGGAVDDDANGSERTGHGFGFDRRIMTMGDGRLVIAYPIRKTPPETDLNEMR